MELDNIIFSLFLIFFSYFFSKYFLLIFKKTKSRKKSKIKTPLIVADIHEKNSLVISELHKSTQVRLEIKSLKTYEKESVVNENTMFNTN